jgi:hypothetical protein
MDPRPIPSGKSYHAFLSHDQGGGPEAGVDYHERVGKINKLLKKENWKTYLPSHKSTALEVTTGIDASAFVLVFVTKRYVANQEDNSGFLYAARRKGVDKMIAVVMEKQCQDQSDWTGILGLKLGNHIYIDMSDDDFENGLQLGIMNITSELCIKTSQAAAGMPPIPSIMPAVVSADEKFDVYLSYRWGEHDSAMADGLFDAISTTEVQDGRKMAVWQDKRCLLDGERFDFGSMRAMANSRVVAPLVSWDALKRMTTLTQTSSCDNVLMDWTMALELNDRSGIAIFPVLFGSQLTDEQGTTAMANLFAERPPKLRADIYIMMRSTRWASLL